MPRHPTPDGLTQKQRRFVEEYMVDGNIVQAAIRAGYAERSAYGHSSTLMKIPHVAAAIEKAKAALSEKLGITAERIRTELWTNHTLARGESDYSASNKSLELLGKDLGMFQDKLEITGAVVKVVDMTGAKDAPG